MLDANTRGTMQDKADAFLEIQNRYFKDDKKDADMTEYTTQPFWQSMYLSKKRLMGKGLSGIFCHIRIAFLVFKILVLYIQKGIGFILHNASCIRI